MSSTDLCYATNDEVTDFWVVPVMISGFTVKRGARRLPRAHAADRDELVYAFYGARNGGDDLLIFDVRAVASAGIEFSGARARTGGAYVPHERMGRRQRLAGACEPGAGRKIVVVEVDVHVVAVVGDVPRAAMAVRLVERRRKGRKGDHGFCQVLGLDSFHFGSRVWQELLFLTKTPGTCLGRSWCI